MNDNLFIFMRIVQDEASGDSESEGSDVADPQGTPFPPMGMFEHRISYYIDKVGPRRFRQSFRRGQITFTVTLGSAIIGRMRMARTSDQISVRLVTGFTGVVLVDASNATYSLMDNNGRNVCTVRYTYEPLGESPNAPADFRVCTVSVQSDETEIVMRSKRPIIRDGIRQLGFGRRRMIPSRKNCILVAGEQHEYAAVMKTSQTSLCVDLIPEIPPHCAAVIGLSAFLYRE